MLDNPMPIEPAVYTLAPESPQHEVEEVLVDPAISRVKFEREVAEYRAHAGEYEQRGWFMLEAEFPVIFVVMAAPNVQWAPVQYGLQFDFRNYDLLAPSLRFVNPFTREPLAVQQVPPLLQARVVSPPINQTEAGEATPPNEFVIQRDLTNLVQGHDGHPAFLCVAGTREYHAHPYHSNDPWLAHRGTGPGRLYYLLDIVWRHGVLPLGWQVSFNFAPRVDPNRV